MAVIISLDGKTKRLEIGESYTFECAGKRLSSTGGLVVTFETSGYLAYNGLVTVGNSGNSRKFDCAGKKMATDIVITAKDYNSGSGSSMPASIRSEVEMDYVLNNATYDSVGTIYKYLGEYSSIYEYGALYLLTEES
jgi:hypothetical protein